MKLICKYYQRIDKGEQALARGFEMSQSDKLRRHIIMNLISGLQLDIAECNEQFGIDFSGKFAREIELLRPMEKDGLLEINARQIQITPTGRQFLRNICMPFDAYLNKQTGNQPPPRYSTTV